MDREIILVCCINESFVVHLNVLLHSILENLSQGYGLTCYVLQADVTAASRQALAAPGVRLEWITVPHSECVDVGSSRFPPEATMRLLIPEQLPQDCHKCIYLDSDTVVDGDLAELWAQDCEGQPVAACQDYRVPRCFPDMSAISDEFARWTLPSADLPKFRELEIPIGTPYFNSGVMILDLDLWRREGLTARARELAAQYRNLFVFGDQCVLNRMLIGRWKPLPPEWNEICELPKEFYPLLQGNYPRRPASLRHYVGAPKPWHMNFLWSSLGIGGDNWRHSRYFTYRYRMGSPGENYPPGYYLHQLFWALMTCFPFGLRVVRWLDRKLRPR